MMRRSMERVLQREWLDDLPVDDPGATGSRRDLRRLNACMGNAKIVARQLRRLPKNRGPHSLVDIGAGDGTFMLRVARHLREEWRGTHLLLVDKQPAAGHQLAARFEQLGWSVELLCEDVLSFLRRPQPRAGQAIIANLFLHHFSEAQLSGLFGALSAQTDVFVAVEPRRSKLALAASRLVWLIGCNRVTRHDAPASVRAGFAGRDLSGLWPSDASWTLREERSGCFSHLFVARQILK
jgi:Methyltransferase domain